MKAPRPVASLSLDLDNKWSYLKTHGDTQWREFPSFLDIVVPRVLGFLKERNLTITFFIVGQDAALARHAEALSAIAESGHEIGNHSFHHEPWLHLYPESQLRTEIISSEEQIERVTGKKPVGFRGPGYSISGAVLKVLLEQGYLYDASTLPTFVGPLARAYYFMGARLSPEAKARRRTLFGKLSDGLRPIGQYRLQAGSRNLIEIPVTTMPIFRVPFHVSYILYLSKFSQTLARSYFKAAVHLCRVTNVEPSLLLHSLDFLSAEDVTDLSFFPAMDLPLGKKLELLDDVLNEFCRGFRVLTLQEHARLAALSQALPVRELSAYRGSV